MITVNFEDVQNLEQATNLLLTNGNDIKIINLDSREVIQWVAAALKENDSITSIKFGSGEIGDVDVEAIAEALKENDSITSIDLSRNEIGDVGAIAIAAALKENDSITSIKFGHNQIRDVGAIAIAAALKENDSITSIDFSYNYIGVAGAIAIAEALRENKSITCIDLVYSQIEDVGAIAIAEALRINHRITNINLSCTNIRDVGAIAIAKALKENNIIASIDFSYNKIGDVGAIAIAEALKENKSIININLTENDIGVAGAIAIAGALRINNGITSIDLSNNDIGVAGAIAIAEALRENKSITYIDLSFYNMGVAGAEALAEALKENDSITSINLSMNNMGVAGAEALAEALRENGSIASIDLSYNKIGDVGAIAIAEALKENDSITSIDFSRNKIRDVGAKALAEALRINHRITNIKLDHPVIVHDGSIAMAKALKENKDFLVTARIKSSRTVKTTSDPEEKLLKSHFQTLIAHLNELNKREIELLFNALAKRIDITKNKEDALSSEFEASGNSYLEANIRGRILSFLKPSDLNALLLASEAPLSDSASSAATGTLLIENDEDSHSSEEDIFFSQYSDRALVEELEYLSNAPWNKEAPLEDEPFVEIIAAQDSASSIAIITEDNSSKRARQDNTGSERSENDIQIDDNQDIFSWHSISSWPSVPMSFSRFDDQHSIIGQDHYTSSNYFLSSLKMILPLIITIEYIKQPEKLLTLEPQSTPDKQTFSFNSDAGYNAILQLKALDTGVDIFKVIDEPNFEHYSTAVRSIIHFSSMIIIGNNAYLSAVSALDVLTQVYQGEYQEAFLQTGATIGYMLLPTLLGTSLAPLYSDAMQIYIANKVYDNIYSLHSNYGTPKSQLKSNLAYRDLYDYLGFKDAAENCLLNAMNIVQEDFKLHSDTESSIQHIANEYSLIGKICSLNPDSNYCNE